MQLNLSLNDLLTTESLALETAKISRMTTEFFDTPIFVSIEQTNNYKNKRKKYEILSKE